MNFLQPIFSNNYASSNILFSLKVSAYSWQEVNKERKGWVIEVEEDSTGIHQTQLLSEWGSDDRDDLHSTSLRNSLTAFLKRLDSSGHDDSVIPLSWESEWPWECYLSDFPTFAVGIQVGFLFLLFRRTVMTNGDKKDGSTLMIMICLSTGVDHQITCCGITLTRTVYPFQFSPKSPHPRSPHTHTSSTH